MEKVRIFPYTDKEAKDAGIDRGLKELNKALPFPSRLRELRNGFPGQPTQKELAEEIGIAKPTVSLYEVGETVPDAKTIVKLANYYGVSTDYILCQTDDPSIHTDVKTAVKVTGLSKQSIETLGKLNLDERLDELLAGPSRPITQMEVADAIINTGDAASDASNFVQVVKLLWASLSSAIQETDDKHTNSDRPKVSAGYIAVPADKARKYALLDAKDIMNKIIDQSYHTLLEAYTKGKEPE